MSKESSTLVGVRYELLGRARVYGGFQDNYLKTFPQGQHGVALSTPGVQVKSIQNVPANEGKTWKKRRRETASKSH